MVQKTQLFLLCNDTIPPGYKLTNPFYPYMWRRWEKGSLARFFFAVCQKLVNLGHFIGGVAWKGAWEGVWGQRTSVRDNVCPERFNTPMTYRVSGSDWQQHGNVFCKKVCVTHSASTITNTLLHWIRAAEHMHLRFVCVVVLSLKTTTPYVYTNPLPLVCCIPNYRLIKRLQAFEFDI